MLLFCEIVHVPYFGTRVDDRFCGHFKYFVEIVTGERIPVMGALRE